MPIIHLIKPGEAVPLQSQPIAPKPSSDTNDVPVLPGVRLPVLLNHRTRFTWSSPVG